ncbi:MAG: hypothetical protein HY899_10185 [Deltaproteobacteria bacterium]|nr:hypothetical protein [Deltaproteobacteria bacterium]
MNRVPLKDSLFMGFCAVFLLVTKGAMRWHLGISGHAMFLTVFFLMLARGCVASRLAATVTGLLAGAGAVALGMGHGGPVLLLNFLLPGATIDAGARIAPGLFTSYARCALVGATAGATKFAASAAMDLMVGMDRAIIVQHALLESVAALLFGIAGGLCVPPVLRRLEAHGVIQARAGGA